MTTSSAARSWPPCPICDRPRRPGKAKPDSEHSPCDRQTRRMEADWATARSGDTTDLLAQKW